VFLGQNQRVVGEVAGQEVSYEQYAAELEEYKQNYALSVGRQPTEQEMPGIRQQVWDRIVFNIAFQEQFDELGLRVTDDEVVDMIQGNNIDPAFGNSFRNEETGEIDRNAIKTFLQNLESYPVQNQVAYRSFEESLRPNRLTTKYQNLLTKSYFATSAEAEREYEAQNSRADIRYVYIPYSSVPDSAVQASDSELKSWYNEHKEDFDREASVSLEYVAFPVEATDTDIKEIENDLARLKEQFRNTADDSAFVDINSESSDNFVTANPGDLPQGLDISSIEAGEVYGPFRENESFKLYKVMEIKQDTVAYARASHILIKTDEDTDKAEARRKAQDVLDQIKAGADFAEMARQYGEDGTRTRGGDLGWFDENTMVAPFNNAVMEADAEGLIPRLVETEFGYHIIDVTGQKTSTVVNMASVEREITPSDQTVSAVYKKTAPFGRATNSEDFAAAADLDSSLIRYQALNLAPDARNINNLYDSRVREIVRWAFADAEVGDVSEIVQLEDQFVVATVTEKTEEGVAGFENVKEQVKAEVLKDKKQEFIMQKLGTPQGTVDDIRASYGNGATVGSATDITLSSSSLPSAGFAPAAIGSAFELEVGQVSEPVADESGVLVVELDKIDEASEVADLAAYRQQIQSRKESGIYMRMKNAIDKFSNARSDLYKYF